MHWIQSIFYCYSRGLFLRQSTADPCPISQRQTGSLRFQWSAVPVQWDRSRLRGRDGGFRNNPIRSDIKPKQHPSRWDPRCLRESRPRQRHQYPPFRSQSSRRTRPKSTSRQDLHHDRTNYHARVPGEPGRHRKPGSRNRWRHYRPGIYI